MRQITVVILGGTGSGKTVLAELIRRSLDSFGFEVSVEDDATKGYADAVRHSDWRKEYLEPRAVSIVVDNKPSEALIENEWLQNSLGPNRTGP